MKEKFGYGRKDDHDLRFRVMEGYEDPKGETLQGTMEDIERLLSGCYFLGINPLRDLREILPQYQWKYHIKNFERREDRELVHQIVSESDFIWLICLPDMDGELLLITATKLDRVPPENLKFFWAGVKKDSEVSTELIDLARKLGGNPVYWENES